MLRQTCASIEQSSIYKDLISQRCGVQAKVCSAVVPHFLASMKRTVCHSRTLESYAMCILYCFPFQRQIQSDSLMRQRQTDLDDLQTCVLVFA
jgi:hypothetical protein